MGQHKKLKQRVQLFLYLLNFAISLPDSIMVVPQILTLIVQVRVLIG